ncbi:hypothetical protein V1477_012027 [Vespula maculifrons]|uniref:Uncharacterized protein n=4 Tax=Vespula TaxID=7451 RepID=A0A834JI12_VESGE|nr:hypothetical protein HZH66_011034 [Vespula vulgaris]KAF7388267.1 hypothetical protein HZH68_012209 [Vespula germanica]KAF7410608.1 hypothetical protein H0235_013215 [Vespula pensylvanica]
MVASPRAKNIAGHPSWTLIKRGLGGSLPVVTACHVGSLKGQRHPEELSQLVAHSRPSYGAACRPRCFRNSLLIRLWAPSLSSAAMCKLFVPVFCMVSRALSGNLITTRRGGWNGKVIRLGKKDVEQEHRVCRNKTWGETS